MMRMLAAVSAALVTLTGCAARWSGEPESRSLAIVGVTVVDVSAADPDAARLPDQTVVVRAGRIVSAGPASAVRPPLNARRVDGRGRFLIPGLWDAHAHVTLAEEPALAVYAARGVTSVRDMGGPFEVLHAWRTRIAGGSLVGPRLYASGPVLEGGWWLDGVSAAAKTDEVLRSFPFLELSPRRRIASEAEGRAAVAELKALGVDHVKFRNLRGAEFRAVAAESRRLGLPLTGHAPGRIGLGEAAEAGMSTIEHSETVALKLDPAPDAERSAHFQRMARAGTALTPTLIADIAYRQTPDAEAFRIVGDAGNGVDPRRRFLTRRMLDAWKFGLDVKKLEGPSSEDHWKKSLERQLRDLRLARAAGTPILVGTDLAVSLVYPGYGVHEEMRHLVTRGGLSPLEALRAATLTPARIIARRADEGLVRSGFEADLVLLSKDPLADIANSEAIEAVILDGRILDRAALERLLESAERTAAKGVVAR